MEQNLSCLFPETFHIILYEYELGGRVMCENEIYVGLVSRWLFQSAMTRNWLLSIKKSYWVRYH